jgi:hypothetical protein
MSNTKWFASKTLWANVVAIAAGFAAKQFGLEIDASTQVAILGVINLALRAITKTPISWS